MLVKVHCYFQPVGARTFLSVLVIFKYIRCVAQYNLNAWVQKLPMFVNVNNAHSVLQIVHLLNFVSLFFLTNSSDYAANGSFFFECLK